MFYVSSVLLSISIGFFVGRQEKELEEQQKIDVQLMEAKRQQRKLNFLITQTELYAHFMANKMTSDDSKEEAAKEEEILGQLDDNKATGRLAEIETYDCDAVKRQAFNNASQAVEAHLDRTRAFNQDTTLAAVEQTPNTAASSAKRGGGGKGQDRPQPTIFQGTLKQYQLKGIAKKM